MNYGEKGKRFQSLLYDWMDYKIEPGYRLAPVLIQNADDNLTENCGHLFMPLEHYERIEEKKAANTQYKKLGR